MSSNSGAMQDELARKLAEREGRESTTRAIFNNPTIREMLKTEKSYNEQMALLIQLVSDSSHPFMQKEVVPALTTLKQISDRLIANVERAIGSEVSEEDRRLLSCQRIGLLKMFYEAYKIYTPLFNKYNGIVNKLTDNFSNIDTLLKSHPNNTQKLDLEMLMAAPMQRGPRYPMLIKEALKQKEGMDELNLDEFQQLVDITKEALVAANANMNKKEQVAHKTRQAIRALKMPFYHPERQVLHAQLDFIIATFGEIPQQDALKVLIRSLETYKKQLDERETQYRDWLRLGYSKQQKQEAVTTLIAELKKLDKNQEINTNIGPHLKALHNGRLGSSLSLWQRRTKRNPIKETALGNLIKQLEAYRNDLDARDEEYTDLFMMGYSRTQKLTAVDALISRLKGKNISITEHMGALKNGTLGKTIRDWEKCYGIKLLKELKHSPERDCKPINSSL